MITRSAGVLSFTSSLVAAGALLMAAAPAGTQDLRVERVAILMRHGVRPPTKDPAMPVGFARDAWPKWSVTPGYLTERGAKAITLAGRADRAALADLISAGTCPAVGTVSLYSDSDQRTIATGDAWAAGFAPGCVITNTHRPQDEPDPDFNAIEMGIVDYDPAAADAVVKATLPASGIAAVEASERNNLSRIDAILCGAPSDTCGVTRKPSGLVPVASNARPKLTGALDRGSTAAQILLLEYADGKPLAEVGWGHATAADIAALGSLHATEFALLARPGYIAERNLAPIAARLRDALAPAPDRPRVTMIVGHDTDIANLGGLLGLHWRIPGFAADDPAPGGAVILSLLRNARGARFIRVVYRAQPLDAIRALTPQVITVPLTIEGCNTLCPRATVERLLGTATRHLKTATR